MIDLTGPRAAVALVWLASCGGSLHAGGTQGQGGSVRIGLGGAGAGGAAGSAGASPWCPKAPATNDPQCHPEDQGLWAAGLPVPALDGDCTPGLTCEIPVGVNNSCVQALGLQTFICCAAVLVNVTGGLSAATSFIPGSTADACPQPIPGQDPACALPLASTCPADGLVCSYQSVYGAGSDAGCYACSTHVDRVRCCGGVWTSGDVCPADADAGVD